MQEFVIWEEALEGVEVGFEVRVGFTW